MHHGLDPLYRSGLAVQIKSNIEEVRARGGELIVITNGDNDELSVLDSTARSIIVQPVAL